MKVLNYNRFQLIKKDLPEIIKRVVTKDVNVGGIKLVYQVSLHECVVFMLFGKQRIIKIPKFSNHNKIERVFLRPYKELWSVKCKNLPKCLWGKNDDPLTMLWVELEADYQTLATGYILQKKEIRDTNINKHLTRTKPLFYIKSMNNQFV